jgi:hypothetical protein
MPRHLTSDQIDSALKRGKSVEQLLERPASDQVAWIELRPVSGAVELWQFKVFDDGSPEFLDLYSFSPVEGDWPEVAIETFPDATTACAAAEDRYSPNSARWVNQFMIQDEYGDDLAHRNKSNGEQASGGNGG